MRSRATALRAARISAPSRPSVFSGPNRLATDAMATLSSRQRKTHIRISLCQHERPVGLSVPGLNRRRAECSISSSHRGFSPCCGRRRQSRPILRRRGGSGPRRLSGRAASQLSRSFADAAGRARTVAADLQPRSHLGLEVETIVPCAPAQPGADHGRAAAHLIRRVCAKSKGFAPQGRPFPSCPGRTRCRRGRARRGESRKPRGGRPPPGRSEPGRYSGGRRPSDTALISPAARATAKT